MIEVSSKFVCCLARISQPRGDLNPEHGFHFINGMRRANAAQIPRQMPSPLLYYYVIRNSRRVSIIARNLCSKKKKKQSAKCNETISSKRLPPNYFENIGVIVPEN